jgi:aryl-alcohol dehydrogenase-like predicted oxidoreductase
VTAPERSSDPVPQVALGAFGLTVSAMGLGCLGMSEFYGTRDDAESRATLDRAIDLGITLLDTSDRYGPFINEELIGATIRARRDRVQLSTKFGVAFNAQGVADGLNGRPEYVEHACDASLRRLRTDVIDLYSLHRLDPKVPIEETVGAMAALVAKGKVRYLGLSEVPPAILRRAAAVHPISALQTEYSLFTRDVEAEILPVCRELGVGFVAYSPLGRGLLTGEITDVATLPSADMRRTRYPRFQGENIARNVSLVNEMARIAARYEATPAQIALAWLFTRPDRIVPIPGTKRRRWLDENRAAWDIRLDPADVATLEEIFAPGRVSGERYFPDVMQRTQVGGTSA